MRIAFHIPFAPHWAFFELGVWPRGPVTKFLLCIGEWVHMGYCNGSWWFDNLQRATDARPVVQRYYADDSDFEDFDDTYPPQCTDAGGHRWVCRDDDEEISYCENCGADGNA